MKTFIQIHLLIFLTLVGFIGCQKKYTLGDRVTDLKIVVTQTNQPNVYNFSTSTSAVIANWDLGNGTKVPGVNRVVGSYPFAGNYTVSLTAYGKAGQANTVSITLPVLEGNADLLKDPVYTALCGEIGSPDGQTWVMDSLLPGHIGVSTIAIPNQINNKAAAANAIVSSGSDLRLGPTLYDDEITFVLNNTDGPAFRYNTGDGKVLVTNTGSNAVYNVFLKAASWAPSSGVAANAIALPAGYTGSYNGDWQVPCTPPAGMKWTLIIGSPYYIHFSDVKNGPGGSFPFNTDWSSDYQILSLTANRLVVLKQTLTPGVGNNLRRMVLIKKGTPSGLPLDVIPEPGSIVQ